MDVGAERDKWIELQRRRLMAQPLAGYAVGESPSAEPVAMAALACIAQGWREPAEAACRRLLEAQQADGAVSVLLNTDGPYWTTSLACIAWRRFDIAWPERARPWCTDAYRLGVDFLLSIRGEKIDPSENVGHNTQLVGWPWVVSTHSWIEPTSLALLALRHCGFAEHERAVEAAELIVDRFLPEGGANYGNTIVLGQVLRPHVLPSAMSLVALHRISPLPVHLSSTLRYLRTELANQPLATASLSWAIQAIVSAEWELPVEQWSNFEEAMQTAIVRLSVSTADPHRCNVLLLASSRRDSPLLDLAPFQLLRQSEHQP